ncbi:MAG: response regulator, partial [Rhodospirillales bacterium]|nr:response regulator [Acetobacter sp.]
AARRPVFGGGQPQQQNNGQGQGQGKRWKKKFRDRERRVGQGGGSGEFRPEGNGFGGGDRQFNNDRGFDRPYRREGGGRPDNFGNLISHQTRKSKGPNGGKERGFVGPMDHSYRETASEFSDAPPSTIQMRGRRGHRHFGDNQPVDHNAPRPVPIPDDAQTHIYLFVEDLFITAKVQETARKLGVKVAFVKNDKDAIAGLTSGDAENRPALIVFDLNNANAKPLTLIPKLKAKLKRSASIIGFLSTIQGDLKAKAVEAGCDTVMPKAAFSQNLPNLLRRYGVEEAEEINYNY